MIAILLLHYLSSKQYIFFTFYVQESRRPHRRIVYDQKIIDILNTWYLKHENNPYATKEQKKELVFQTSLTEKQITTWLINTRHKNGYYLNKINEDINK